MILVNLDHEGTLEQGLKKFRSLRSGILDNSYLVRQIRLDPGGEPILVRQIWPDQRPCYSFDKHLSK